MFVWLGIALFIDGVDGTFARRLRVADVLPRWSGDVLDLVVDILNYVFVPAYALAASGLLPRPLAIPLGILIVVTGSLYFADRLMKTSDYYFRGFPALWNVAAFYLFLLRPAPWLGAVADRGACGADFRAVSRRAPDAHRAFARVDDGRAHRCGRCSPSSPWREISSPAFGLLPACAYLRSISSASAFCAGIIPDKRSNPVPRPVLLIAGGSRGIGASTARLAGERGYDVAINYVRNAKAAAEVAEAVKKSGGKAVTLQGDMRKKTTS